ncbi:MAG: glycosyltransferase family 2 protein [Actinomycetota bacterium]|nr:glycosyltransferase family 2 protein [Actinomycetota bacterium]
MGTTSVIIVTYQSEPFIGSVLDALLSDEDAPHEVIVVDNASTDGTLRIVDRPGIKVVASPENLGFAGGCHAGAEAATGSTLVFLGHDTVPVHGWLPPLVSALEDPTIGASMATIEDADRSGRFNTSGGHLTYFGLAWVSDLGEPIPPDEADIVDVPFPSGAAMAVTRKIWDRFDGFRRSLFMYHEDTDLGWRLRLAGLRVVRVPGSRVLHHYDFSRAPQKMYWLERNRHVLLATNYRAPTRIVLAPAFLLADLGVWFVAARDGWSRQKLQARRESLSDRSRLTSERRSVARIRSVGDATILRTMDRSVSGMRQVSSPRGSRIIDAILGAYLGAALPIVAFFDRRAGFAA